MADGVINKPLVAHVDRRVEVFGGIRGISFPSRRWLTWIAVHKPLLADGLVYKPLVACVDRCLQAFGGRWSRLQAFGGIRGSSITSLWWQMELLTFGGIRGSSCTRLLLASVDRRVEAFGGIRGLSFPSRRWLTWIAVRKPLVADGVVYKPLVACVDRL